MNYWDIGPAPMRPPLSVKIGSSVFLLACATGLLGVFVGLPAALAAAAVGGALLGWLLSRPLRLMTRVAGEIRDRSYEVVVPSTFLASQEERALARILDDMARVVVESAEDMDSIVELVTQLKRAYQQLQSRDEILSMELDLAARIQTGIMPETPFVHHGFRVVAHYEAVDKLGGDFFDLAVLPNQNLAVLIADVSGHGPPAALITALTKLSFLHAVGSVFHSPREILRRLNASITEVVATQEYLTAFCMILGTDHWAVFSNAGHHLPLVMRKRGRRLEEWGREGMIIGMFPDAAESIHEDEDRLEMQDRLLLFTDGLVEATNEKNEDFGHERLKSLLIETMDLPLEEQRDSLLESWRDFVGDKPAADDVCFLILEVGDAERTQAMAASIRGEHERMQELVADLE